MSTNRECESSNNLLASRNADARRAKIVAPSPPPFSLCPQYQQTVGRNTAHHILSVIEAMEHKESTTYKPFHYLKNVEVSENDREEMCKWGFGVVEAIQLDRQIATIAIQYFDRYLSNRGLRSVEICLSGQREFQLAFIVSL